MIEIGAGGHSGSRRHSEPGQSLPGTNAAGKAQGAEWGGALGVSASTSFIPAAASFRSSWQSELASLNADLECSSKEGAAADQSSASTEGLTIESAQGNSATITTTSQSPSQRSGLENSKQIALTVGKENLSLAGTGSGIAIPRTAVGALRQPSSTPAPKSGATVSGDTGFGWRSSAFGHHGRASSNPAYRFIQRIVFRFQLRLDSIGFLVPERSGNGARRNDCGRESCCGTIKNGSRWKRCAILTLLRSRHFDLGEERKQRRG